MSVQDVLALAPRDWDGAVPLNEDEARALVKELEAIARKAAQLAAYVASRASLR